MAAKFEQGLMITMSPLGHFSLTASSAAVGLPNLPDLQRLRRVVILPQDNPVRFRDDGTDPTPTTGMKVFSNQFLVYDSSFDVIKFVKDTAATSDVTVLVAYYGT